MIPVIATILKVVAVVFLVLFLVQAIQQFGATFESWSKGQQSMYGMGSAAIKGFLPRLMSLMQPMFSVLIALLVSGLTWGFSDLFLAARELEFHRRADLEAKGTYVQEAVVKASRDEPVAV
jgi:preprotein translocase subunit SecG